ncbi:MAG: CpsD/CapB family tyrosine-protein kinase [Sedimentitalea sp.]|uniref:CpsD/CapB family tyrosine-protein kinase n=1 Tax=Sedimentitalea sp. TaxID=2048915 RepID=UPI003267CD55
MERLSSAIEKARREREAAKGKSESNSGKPSVADGASPDNAANKPGTGLATLWQSLPSVKVDAKHLNRNMILTYQANTAATPFDVMRTKLLHQMRHNNWRRVAITSPGANCGKTTLSLNLAFSLARQTDIRVMVLEMDLRSPAMARMLGHNQKTNFAAALAGVEPAEKHILRYGDNLAFATSHSRAPSTAELLQGLTAAEVIDNIEARYEPDLMIFDMPPMLVADDTLAFLDQIDCALLIGAAEATTLDEIGKCKQDIEARTNVMGVVLNKCRYLASTEEYDSSGY